MTLKEAAQIYVDLVRLEESLSPDQRQARTEVTALRSKYHDLFAEALRVAGIQCADRFEAAQRAADLVFIDELLETGLELARCLPAATSGVNRVLKAMEQQAHHMDAEGVQDHLAVLRVSAIFGASTEVSRIQLEESCGQHEPPRPHDIIVYTRDLRIVHEVKRIRPDTLDGAAIEREHTDTITPEDLSEDKLPTLLKEVRLRTEKTSALAELVKAVRQKSDQYCPAARNIVWFVTRNFLFAGKDVRDAAWFERGGHRLRPEDQREKAYRPPAHLTGIGYLHDVSITTRRPSCFLIQQDDELRDCLQRAGIVCTAIREPSEHD